MSQITYAERLSHMDATSPAHSAKEIFRQLDGELVRTFGLQHKAPRGIPELAIAAFDFGTRAMLEAYGLIESETRRDGTQDITITPLGQEVIKLCSENLPTVENSELADAVRQAGDLLSLAATSSVRAVPA